jgi:CRP-like cAMP-binding protein
MGAGEHFGDLSQDVRVHEASVSAATPTEYLFVQKHVFEEKNIWDNVNVLRKTELFDSWSRNRLLQLCSNLKARMCDKGQEIYTQGDPICGLYFLKKGSVAVQKDLHIVRRNRWPTTHGQWEEMETHLHQAVKLLHIEEGGYFGESLQRDGLRTATVRATELVEVLFIAQCDFLRLIQGSRQVIDHLKATRTSHGKEVADEDDKEAIALIYEAAKAKKSTLQTVGARRPHRRDSLHFDQPVASTASLPGAASSSSSAASSPSATRSRERETDKRRLRPVRTTRFLDRTMLPARSTSPTNHTALAAILTERSISPTCLKHNRQVLSLTDTTIQRRDTRQAVTPCHTNCHPPTVVRCTLFKPRGEDRNLGKIQKMEDGMGKGLGRRNEGAVN